MLAEGPTLVAMEAAGVTAAGAAIDDADGAGDRVYPAGSLDSFQCELAISLELLENTVFPFASHTAVQYLKGSASPNEPAAFMIVCSCNVLSDHDVRSAVEGTQQLHRNAKQIYGCLGCSAECGRCARTIKTIIDDALGACAKACCVGCPHSHAAHDHDRPADTVGALQAAV